MSDDVVERAKAALEKYDPRRDQFTDDRFIGLMREVVPELIAEIEQLRKGGPWIEHVERQKAMKRERDGECICNTGPDTDGPDECCPWHGRPYSYWVEAVGSSVEDGTRPQNAEEEP